MPPAGPAPLGAEGLPQELHGAGQVLAVRVCPAPRLEQQAAVFGLLLLANPIHFPACRVLLSWHQGILAEGGWEDVKVLIWQAGTKCFENQYGLRKAQGGQYFPSGTCLSPSPHSG